MGNVAVWGREQKGQGGCELVLTLLSQNALVWKDLFLTVLESRRSRVRVVAN